jgi:hypothetical protein
MILAGVLLMTEHALASDQADYSAPYITFEDGKLVTKDPTKELVTAQPGTHSTDDAGNAETIMPEPSSAMTDITANQTEGSVAESGLVRYIAIASSAVILFITAIIYYKLRSRRVGKESHII